MPPKAKVTRDMIVDAAFDLVRAEGQGALNARAVARRLGCSTQPVLYAFATMEELKAAVYARADDFHTAYILPKDAAGDAALLALGLNYVRFGHEERHLFRFLFESNQFEPAAGTGNGRAGEHPGRRAGVRNESGRKSVPDLLRRGPRPCEPPRQQRHGL